MTARRLAVHLLAGLALACAIIGGLRAGAVALLPPDRGMDETPCPTPDHGWSKAVTESLLDLAGKSEPLRDPAGMCVYQRANAELLRSGAPVRAVFIGDSITARWIDFQPAMFGAGTIDRGIGGQTSGQVLLRMGADALDLHPQVIHVMVGGNDVGGRWGPERPDDFRDHVTAIAALARARGVRLVIGSIPPFGRNRQASHDGSDPHARIGELNAWLRQFAEREGLIFVDYTAVLATPDGMMRTDLSSDGLHPNAAGYAAMAPLAREAIAAALAGPAVAAANLTGL